MYKIVFFKNRRGQYPVKDFITSLDKKIRAKIYRHLKMLEQEGPNLPRPYADHVRGKIRELRIRFGRINVRILYFIQEDRIMVLLHSFIKKTWEIPAGELGQAERNMEEWIGG